MRIKRMSCMSSFWGLSGLISESAGSRTETACSMSKWSDMRSKNWLKNTRSLVGLVYSLRGLIQGMHKHPDKQMDSYTNKRTPVILFPWDPTIFVKNKAGYMANKQFAAGAVCRWAGAVVWWAGAVFWVGRGCYAQKSQSRPISRRPKFLVTYERT